MMKWILPIALTLIGAITIASCFTSGETDGRPRMVLTESTNIKAELLNTPQVVTVPIETLGGDIGAGLKEVFSERGSFPVLTMEDNLLFNPNNPAPGSTVPPVPPVVVVLDGPTTRELLSPEIIAVIAKVVGVAVPGPWQPWVAAVGGILSLFSTRFRTHGANALKRAIPGVKDPEGRGGMTHVGDIADALVDTMKAITFRPTVTETSVEKPLNG